MQGKCIILIKERLEKFFPFSPTADDNLFKELIFEKKNKIPVLGKSHGISHLENSMEDRASQEWL